jgi:hypothetical protein
MKKNDKIAPYPEKMKRTPTARTSMPRAFLSRSKRAKNNPIASARSNIKTKINIISIGYRVRKEVLLRGNASLK